MAADTEAIAEEVLDLIDIEWEQRQFLLGGEEALKPGAPLTNPEECPGKNHFNEGMRDIHALGDSEKGLAEADVIFEFTSRRCNDCFEQNKETDT